MLWCLDARVTFVLPFLLLFVLRWAKRFRSRCVQAGIQLCVFKQRRNGGGGLLRDSGAGQYNSTSNDERRTQDIDLDVSGQFNA